MRKGQIRDTSLHVADICNQLIHSMLYDTEGLEAAYAEIMRRGVVR
jgi:hypothetical protein